MKIEDIEQNIPPALLLELKYLAEHLKYEDDDIVIVFDGRERAGKSTAARMVGAWFGYYFGIGFSVNNISFDTASYMKKSQLFNKSTRNKVKGYVNILDESRADLYKRRASSSKLMAFTDYLTAVGKWRQIHILVLPSFHDLDRYITRWRMKYLIHMKKIIIGDKQRISGKRFMKGAYRLFTIQQLRKQMNNLVRDFSYPRKAFIDNDKPFGFFEVLSDEELKIYEEWKDEYIGNIINTEDQEQEIEQKIQYYLQKSERT